MRKIWVDGSEVQSNASSVRFALPKEYIEKQLFKSRGTPLYTFWRNVEKSRKQG